MSRRKKYRRNDLRKLSGSPKSQAPDELDQAPSTDVSADLIRQAVQRATAPHFDRKAMQLCRQIERELTLILSGELDDDRVRDLTVLSVHPFPSTNLLLVTLQAPEICTQQQLLQLDQILAQHKPTIRAEIAAAIHRRKTPELCFRVINVAPASDLASPKSDTPALRDNVRKGESTRRSSNPDSPPDPRLP